MSWSGQYRIGQHSSCARGREQGDIQRRIETGGSTLIESYRRGGRGDFDQRGLPPDSRVVLELTGVRSGGRSHLGLGPKIARGLRRVQEVAASRGGGPSRLILSPA